MKYYSGLCITDHDINSEIIVKDMVGLIDGNNINRIIKTESIVCCGSGESKLELLSAVDNENFTVIFNGEMNHHNNQSPSKIILTRLQTDTLKQIAETTEGVFVIIILDKKSRELHFLTDRMGLRTTYFYVDVNRIYWSSECKSFLSKYINSPGINEDAFHEIIQNGHLSGTHTLLKNVQLLPAGSILTYNIDSRIISTNTYWTWNPNTRKSDNFKADIKKYSELVLHQLKQSIQTKMGSRHLQHGHFLSGGLDSRAILASMDSAENMMTITFGAKNSLDHIFAKKISTLAKTNHHFIEIDKNNWLEHRLKAVWWTDGQFNLLHMHGAEALDVLQQTDIIFSGAMEKLIRGHDISIFKNFEDLVSRERRFIRNGSSMDDKVTHTRFPFYNYALMDTLKEIPADIRKNDIFYYHFLTSCFPKFFNHIPDSNSNIIINSKFYRARQIKMKILRKLGLINYAFHNYPEWIRHQRMIVEVILSENCYLNDLGYGGRVRKYLKNIGNLNNNDSEGLCMLITLELYLYYIKNPYQVNDYIKYLNKYYNLK